MLMNKLIPIVVGVILLTPFGLSAQPGEGQPPGDGSPVPLGFTEVLLLAGAAYGGIKAKSSAVKKN